MSLYKREFPLMGVDLEVFRCQFGCDFFSERTKHGKHKHTGKMEMFKHFYEKHSAE